MSFFIIEGEVLSSEVLSRRGILDGSMREEIRGCNRSLNTSGEVSSGEVLSGEVLSGEVLSWNPNEHLQQQQYNYCDWCEDDHWCAVFVNGRDFRAASTYKLYKWK